MTELSKLHRLAYAGVDLSSLSGPRSLYFDPGARELAHGSEYCSGKGYRRRYYSHSSRTEASVDPTTVIASKACPTCFDRALKGLSAWDDLALLAEAIPADEARFLRTSFAAKSKKNTPENAALQAQELMRIANRIPTYLSGDAKHEADMLVRRLTDRASEFRVLIGSEMRDPLLREAAALKASLSTGGTPDVPADLARTLHPNWWESEKALEKAHQAWVQALATGQTLEEAGDAFAVVVTAHDSIQSIRQLDFELPSQLPEPGTNLQAWIKQVRHERIATLLSEMLNAWGSRYTETLDDATTSLVSLTMPPTITENLPGGARLLSSLVELFLVRRKERQVFLLMPTALVPVLSTIVHSYGFSLLQTPADGVSMETADTAASLFDPSDPDLPGVLELARALV